MYSYVYSGGITGIDGYIVTVEADVSDGLPVFDMVGFLASEVREARERVRTALRNAEYHLPAKRITVNLSPADIRKEGTAFDLPIAIAVLASSGYISQQVLQKILLIGELGLDGKVHKVNGVLPIVMQAVDAGYTACIVPAANGVEAAVAKGISVFGASHIKEVIQHLNNKERILPTSVNLHELLKNRPVAAANDFSHIKGQLSAKRGAEIAAAGMHNLLFVGPPGSGKSMISKRIPGILPDLTLEESLEITKVYSVAGLLSDRQNLIVERPFRAPHHTISDTALAGGGRYPKPGEISLAHRGILYLDELPEFSRQAIEVLRQPMEDGKVTISRVNAGYTFPADMMVVVAMNGCPCGYYPDVQRCSCTHSQIKRYLGRISRPLLDRIDISIEVAKVTYSELDIPYEGDTSADIKKRVQNAHHIQTDRYRKEKIHFNAQLDHVLVDKYCQIDTKQKRQLKRAFENFAFSARAYHRILKTARTIADLNGDDKIGEAHLMEAIHYRVLDGSHWSL